MMDDGYFNETRAAARERLRSLDRLEALCKLREQARESNRAAMLKSIENLIRVEQRALERDLDGEPA